MSDLTSPTIGGRGSGAAGGLSGAGFTGGGAIADPPIPSNRDQAPTHRLRVDPSRSMKAITGEVEALLDGLEEDTRRRATLLASELVAQVVGRAGSHSGPVALTVKLRADAVRLEATGPVAPSMDPIARHDAGPTDPLADWGRFIIDRLADRWAITGGPRRVIWAEIR